MFNNVLPSVVNTVKPHSFTVDLPEDAVEARNEFLDIITSEMSKKRTNPCSSADHQHRIDEIVKDLKIKYNIKK